MLNLLSTATQGDVPDALFVALWVVVVVTVILAVSGSVAGYNRKIVVYHGRSDLYLTIASIISWVFCGIALYHLAEGPWIPGAVLVLSAIVTIACISRSFRANNTVWAGILSVFAKYTLVVLIAFCAMIAIGGALAAIEDAKKKDHKEAAKNAAAAAVGAVGFLALRKLISRLITESQS